MSVVEAIGPSVEDTVAVVVEPEEWLIGDVFSAEQILLGDGVSQANIERYGNDQEKLIRLAKNVYILRQLEIPIKDINNALDEIGNLLINDIKIAALKKRVGMSVEDIKQIHWFEDFKNSDIESGEGIKIFKQLLVNAKFSFNVDTALNS